GAEPFGMRGRHMVCISRGASAHDLSIDPGTTGQGMLQLFEHQRTGAFAQHKTIAVFVKRAGCGLRCIVTRRERMHGVEPADARYIHRSFRSAGNDDIRLSETDIVEGIDKAMGRRSAGRYGGKIGSAETELDRNMAGRYIHDHLGNKEGAEPRGAVS